MNKRSSKLMIPGPVQPDQAVLDAMGQPVRPHYGPEFRDYYNQTIDLLKRVFETDGDAFLMVGSGSAGIDACIGSALSSGEKIIVGINGFFGERLQAIADGYGLKVITVHKTWGEALAPLDFMRALDEHPDAQAVALVHLETSTTIVNPVAEIGELTQSRGVALFVDAVSSLGGEPFSMDDWGIDLCASSSQKCLGAPPGLAPIAVSARGWKTIDRNPNKGHGWYLNLRTWRQYAIDWGDWHPFPITMATNNIAALRTSLDSLLAEGIEARRARYQRLAIRLRDGLRRIGMTPFTPDEHMSSVITAAYGPEGVPTSHLVSYLDEVHNIKIAGGLGALKDQVFRIGHMSPTTSEGDIDDVLDALSDFQRSLTR